MDEPIGQTQQEINAALTQGMSANTEAIAAEVARAVKMEKRIRMFTTYMGYLTDPDDLPALENTRGDYYVVLDGGVKKFFVWDGEEWVDNGAVDSAGDAWAEHESRIGELEDDAEEHAEALANLEHNNMTVGGVKNFTGGILTKTVNIADYETPVAADELKAVNIKMLLAALKEAGMYTKVKYIDPATGDEVAGKFPAERIVTAAFNTNKFITEIEMPYTEGCQSVTENYSEGGVSGTLGAFSRLFNLRKAKFAMLNSVAGYMFAKHPLYGTSLEEVEFPLATWVKERAFYQCTSLKRIVIPNLEVFEQNGRRVVNCGAEAFKNVANVEEIDFRYNVMASDFTSDAIGNTLPRPKQNAVGWLKKGAGVVGKYTWDDANLNWNEVVG